MVTIHSMNTSSLMLFKIKNENLKVKWVNNYYNNYNYMNISTF